MRPLAEQGNGGAQFFLGVMYHEGNGVPQDYAQALAWSRKAADQGNATAQYLLGVMYEKGQGVPQDLARALAWHRKAADQGDAEAQDMLGMMYANGQGVPQDYVQAHMWFNLAASRASAQEVHYSPEERLDAIDVQLISTAKQSVDFASYALTDRAVIDALNAADHRGVVIRIVLDPRERHDFVALGDLADNVRLKRGGPFMHLKAYAIDGVLLRTGSANFSTSGENAQDNDLIVIRDAGAAARFDGHFERMWDAAQPMIEFDPAVRALEPK